AWSGQPSTSSTPPSPSPPNNSIASRLCTVPSGVSWQSAPAAAIKTRNVPEIHSPAVLYGKAKSVISTRAWLQADIDKAAEWKSKTVAGWWADMQKVASFKGKAAEVTVGEMTDEVPVADLVNQAFEDMEKKKAEEKNVFGSFDNADSGPELLTSILEYKFSSLFPILSGVATFDLWGDPIFFVFVLKSASKYTE
ncbi:unnamed protein product, partial [Fusarium graminearum]